MPESEPDPFEPFVNRHLRSLPDRSAPRTLETRVLAEIQAGRQPSQAGRAVLLALSAAAAAGFAALPFYLARHVPAGTTALDWAAGRFEWFAALRTLVDAAAESARTLVQVVPEPWITWTVAALTGSYAILAGVGAVAYRVFHRPARNIHAFLP